MGNARSGVNIGVAGGNGALVDGVTFNLSGGSWLFVNHNVLGAGSVLNTSGPAVLAANNANMFAGQINVGVGTPGTAELDLFPSTDTAPPGAALFDANSGSININSGSKLFINPYTGGFGAAGQSPNTGFFNFYNQGSINVAPGGTLLDEIPSVAAGGVYDSDFTNDGVVNIRGDSGKGGSATFDVNVTSSTSFFNALDTPNNVSTPARGNIQGRINLEGGAAAATLTFTGNVSDQAIRAHNAQVAFIENEATNQPRAWGGSIDLRGNSNVVVQGNFIAPSFPIGAKPGDPDYTKVMSYLEVPIYGFDSTDFLQSFMEDPSGVGAVVWHQDTHTLNIQEGLDATAALAQNTPNVTGSFILAGAWSQSDFRINTVSYDGITKYLKVTTANATHADGFPLFDRGYYLAHNPDIAAAGIDPYQHFLDAGWKEGRDPSGLFSLGDYLAANPDVAAAHVDPLLQYENFGQAEGRAAFAVPGSPPDPLVNAAFYYAANPDVKAAGIDASAHYYAGG